MKLSNLHLNQQANLQIKKADKAIVKQKPIDDQPTTGGDGFGVGMGGGWSWHGNSFGYKDKNVAVKIKFTPTIGGGGGGTVGVTVNF